ncbi:SWIM zinc finger family protein [Streptomonospora alba]|uniref:SWIM zinc finger family protein n=1 Tax=Streptomonospora alba TaxID=183763 RepID=UPI00069A3D57|nr:SWIM zinc finger family protein [Streptomonospora alba]
MSTRWTPDDVWALAPDPSSRRAAVATAAPSLWSAAGHRPAGDSTPPVVWGECAGSGAASYRVVAELVSPPDCSCSCPSRKTPCKHALALMHLWAEGGTEPGEAPERVARWLARRADARPGPPEPADPRAAADRLERREERVAEGLVELDLWLRDQVANGLAASRDDGYRRLDSMAARLVDAQAGRLADRVRDLSRLGAARDRPDRLLSEYALLRLLISAYRRRDDLAPDMRATVTCRAGLPVSADESAPVRDTWRVLGMYDFPAGQVHGRRIWLHGTATGRTAALVSFAPTGQAPQTPVRPGTAVEADLAFYPAERRARVVALHAEHSADPPAGAGAEEALRSYADALAEDPWLEAWPVVLRHAAPVRGDPWSVADAGGAALPLLPECSPCWPLAAVCGGEPATVAGEWTPRGLRPLAVWDRRARFADLHRPRTRPAAR